MSLDGNFKLYKDNILSRSFGFEIYLCKHCNLKCRACARYCNMAECEIYDFDKLKDDLLKIKRSGIKLSYISFSGGEPTIHPRFLDIVKMVREMFKFVQLCMVTNGIVLSKASESYYQVLKDAMVTIIYTVYPTKIDYERIRTMCKSFGITHRSCAEQTNDVNPIRNVMYTNRLSKHSNINRYAKRILLCANDCPCLWNGKFYKCFTIPFIDVLNKKFDEDFEIHSDDYLEVSDTLDINRVLDFYMSPCSFCDYCYNVSNCGVAWCRGVVEKTDYIRKSVIIKENK